MAPMEDHDPVAVEDAPVQLVAIDETHATEEASVSIDDQIPPAINEIPLIAEVPSAADQPALPVQPPKSLPRLKKSLPPPLLWRYRQQLQSAPRHQPRQSNHGPVEYRKLMQRFCQFLAEEEKFWSQLSQREHYGNIA
jgi:hypothetical protein